MLTREVLLWAEWPWRSLGHGLFPKMGQTPHCAPGGISVTARDLHRERQLSDDKMPSHQTSPCGNGMDLRVHGAGTAFMMQSHNPGLVGRKAAAFPQDPQLLWLQWKQGSSSPTGICAWRLSQQAPGHKHRSSQILIATDVGGAVAGRIPGIGWQGLALCFVRNGPTNAACRRNTRSLGGTGP